MAFLATQQKQMRSNAAKQMRNAHGEAPRKWLTKLLSLHSCSNRKQTVFVAAPMLHVIIVVKGGNFAII